MIRFLALAPLLTLVNSFSTPLGRDGSLSFFDRFRASKVDTSVIQRFDDSLAQDDHPSASWVAVFRSANNKPSVFVRDSFFSAMKTATTSSKASGLDPTAGIELTNESILEATETPVAVARLTPSIDFDDCWVLDNMRCILKKEDMNPDCDGGSEHTEALGVAIDSLLIHYLTNNRDAPFHGAIRTKATLVSGPLLEQRGFQEVDSLSKDMATHTCSLDECMKSYADRALSTLPERQGARERALQLCSLLGQIDRDTDLKAVSEELNNGEDEIDPWAGMKRFF